MAIECKWNAIFRCLFPAGLVCTPPPSLQAEDDRSAARLHDAEAAARRAVAAEADAGLAALLGPHLHHCAAPPAAAPATAPALPARPGAGEGREGPVGLAVQRLVADQTRQLRQLKARYASFGDAGGIRIPPASQSKQTETNNNTPTTTSKQLYTHSLGQICVRGNYLYAGRQWQRSFLRAAELAACTCWPICSRFWVGGAALFFACLCVGFEK